MLRDGSSIDWLVMRNRLSSLDARNKRRTNAVLARLAGRVGFRLAPGFGERVIYRELFLQGLTLLDLGGGDGPDLTMSHVAARQELRGLMAALTLPNASRSARAG
jgi:chromosome partitioning protein